MYAAYGTLGASTHRCDMRFLGSQLLPLRVSAVLTHFRGPKKGVSTKTGNDILVVKPTYLHMTDMR